MQTANEEITPVTPVIDAKPKKKPKKKPKPKPKAVEYGYSVTHHSDQGILKAIAFKVPEQFTKSVKKQFFDPLVALQLGKTTKQMHHYVSESVTYTIGYW